MKNAVEASFTRQGVAVIGKEQLAHALEVDGRLHLVGHLGPVLDVGIAADVRFGPVGEQRHPLEVHHPAIHAEGGLHRHAHRHVVLNPDRAAVKVGFAAIAGELGDGDVEVGRDRAPARAVIVERHGAVLRSHVLHRRDEPPRSIAAADVEFREAVFSAGPLLEHHVPIGHLDRIDEHLAAEQRFPRERHVDPLRREEGTIARHEALDDEVLNHELAVEQAHAQLPDVHRPPDALRPLALGKATKTRAQIERQRRDNRHGQRRRQYRRPPAW